MLTQEYLKSILHYDPETGIFTWLKCRNKNLVGSKAGYICSSRGHGYVKIRIKSKQYLAHRLAFLYMGGKIPQTIDHINQDRADNRWCNLRECTRSQNGANQKSYRKNNTSGYRGVHLHPCGKYMSRMCNNGRRYYLGLFDNPEAAHEAYKKAHSELFGEFSPFFSAG